MIKSCRTVEFSIMGLRKSLNHFGINIQATYKKYDKLYYQVFIFVFMTCVMSQGNQTPNSTS